VLQLIFSEIRANHIDGKLPAGDSLELVRIRGAGQRQATQPIVMTTLARAWPLPT